MKFFLRHMFGEMLNFRRVVGWVENKDFNFISSLTNRTLEVQNPTNLVLEADVYLGLEQIYKHKQIWDFSFLWSVVHLTKW